MTDRSKPIETPEARLLILARSAVETAKGDNDKAYEALDKWIIEANSARLERELTKEWRKLALRSLLATAFTALRADGKIRRPAPETHINTTDYSRTWAPGQGRSYPTPSEIQADAQRTLQRRWFEDYKINGMALGDCTTGEAERWAYSRERDARFIRLLIMGLPDNVKIRDYRSEEDCAKCWENAA